MTKESLLMQYQSECRNALESVVNISKSFQKVFMDAMKLFMAIPNRVNFLQMGRYGCFSEQTYRNNFENDDFDWFSFNEAIIREHLKGGRKAIAVDPSFIPKSGSKTPWIGYFWSGCAGEYKRGLEITGIGVIDVDNHECMTLGSVQTPDNATLESYGKNLVDWYSSYLISIQEHLKRISGTVVCDAFFSKATFIKPLCENGFHVISRFRNDAVLFYPTLENRTGKRGRPKLYDGKIDFENLDITRCTEYKVNKGKLYGLKAYSKALKRFCELSCMVSYGWKNGQMAAVFLHGRDAGCQGGFRLLQDTFPARILLSRCQATCRNDELSGNRLQKTGISLQCVTCSDKPCQSCL
ncbi:hypothetical protein BACCOP_03258 [Phocaeicola coprocola DSM 17136]|uniref:Transposase IS701-like DDE domain-containing protein n=1 Tax=Phocaeicola coprocola DSM 17136 TaxID=470145 RepID=B3JMV3_9BACT|nr:hypothetical protein [Phocaeicola coprocola]EDU99713.1 hypothetical protein BACCOP_03258 [Phocaeicola coprocola DSM 17136]